VEGHELQLRLEAVVGHLAVERHFSERRHFDVFDGRRALCLCQRRTEAKGLVGHDLQVDSAAVGREHLIVDDVAHDVAAEDEAAILGLVCGASLFSDDDCEELELHKLLESVQQVHGADNFEGQRRLAIFFLFTGGGSLLVAAERRAFFLEVLSEEEPEQVDEAPFAGGGAKDGGEAQDGLGGAPEAVEGRGDRGPRALGDLEVDELGVFLELELALAETAGAARLEVVEHLEDYRRIPRGPRREELHETLRH